MRARKRFSFGFRQRSQRYDPQKSALFPNFPGLPFIGPTTENVPHPNFVSFWIFVSRFVAINLKFRLVK
jgi:hypothetical protein